MGEVGASSVTDLCALCPWASHSTPLILCFSNCKMGQRPKVLLLCKLLVGGSGSYWHFKGGCLMQNNLLGSPSHVVVLVRHKGQLHHPGLPCARLVGGSLRRKAGNNL